MGAPEWIARLQSLVAAGVKTRHVLSHAVQRLPGFKFDETMAGKVSFTGGDLPTGDRDIVLQLHVSTPRFGSYLRHGRTTLTGTATVEGIVDKAPLTGSLWIWPHRRIVRYECFFPVADQRLRLAGQKDVRLLDFRHTMSTLPAQLFDESGREVGQATVVFDWADLPSFLRSFAPLSASASASPDVASADNHHAARSSTSRPA